MMPLMFLLILQLCTSPQSQRVGNLPAQIDEASGIAISRAFPGRIYHVNDSGSKGDIYATSLAGDKLQRVEIEAFKPKDVEALGIGPCGNGKSCLFIGDIGDNDSDRKTIEVIVVEEPPQMGGRVPILRRIRMNYPDSPRNSESMAVHPDGTILLLTKQEKGMEQLFKLRPSQWQRRAEGALTLIPAGTINIKAIVPNTDSFGIRPTAMDISPDGKRLLVLTYRDAIEFVLDIRKTEPLSSPRRISLEFLMQQEAVAYVPGESSFIYSSEYQLLPPWIMKAACGR